MTTAEPRQELLGLHDVTVVFGSASPGWSRLSWLSPPRTAVAALDHVNISIARGEAVGLVGESGSGKSTSGRLLMGMLKATGGQVLFDGANVGAMKRNALKALRGQLQMVYQDAEGSMDSRMRIGASIAEPLRIHGGTRSRAETNRAVHDALELVGLSPASAYIDRYPKELSGGQQQRVVLARALITRPAALILDESLASADVSIRVTLLDLLIELRRSLELTYIFITHELALARYMCDRLVILYRGKVVEIGPTNQVFEQPRHPYTKALIEAVPARHKSPLDDSSDALKSDTLLVSNRTGCALYGRCPIGVAGVCDVQPVSLQPVSGEFGHEVACHFADSAGRTAGMGGAAAAHGQLHTQEVV